MDGNNFFIKLLKFNMFDRVGKQIKGLATEISSTILALFLIASIACIVVPFFVIDEMHFGWFLLALLVALVIFGIGYLIAWLSGLFMYGFGELIDSAASINEKLAQGAQLSEEPKRFVQEAAKHTAEKYETEKRAGLEADERLKKAVQAGSADDALQTKLEHALRFETDESMIRCLTGIQNEAIQEILKSPQHTIRAQIQNILSDM